MSDGERRKPIDNEVCRTKVKGTTSKNRTKNWYFFSFPYDILRTKCRIWIKPGTHMPGGERRKPIDIADRRTKVKVTTSKNRTKKALTTSIYDVIGHRLILFLPRVWTQSVWRTIIMLVKYVSIDGVPQAFLSFLFVYIIVITVHDRFWNVGQANCILKYFENSDDWFQIPPFF